MKLLQKAAAIVAHKDSGAFRQSAFNYLAAHNTRVSAARRFYSLLGGGSWAATLLVSGYGLAAYLRVIAPSQSGVWAIGRYRNEERQFAFVEECTEVSLGRIRIDTRGVFTWATLTDLIRLLLSPGEIVRVLRLVHHYGQRKNFLVSCRIAATAGFTARFTRLMRRGTPPTALIVSSDTNPYAVGASVVAEELGIPRIYITHGHMPANPPPVDFDLWLLDGPALQEVYSRTAPIQGAVVYKGAEGERRPLNTEALRTGSLTVGVFASLLVDWQKTAEVITRIEETLQPDRLIVRFHPNKTIRDPRAELWLPQAQHIEYSDGATVLTEDAARCDLVFAGNSSCHLTLLKFGVPTAYVRGLDIVPHDFYDFIRDEIIPSYEHPDTISLNDIAAFFEDPDWMQRFMRYDASYEFDPCTIRNSVSAAVKGLLNESASSTVPEDRK